MSCCLVPLSELNRKVAVNNLVTSDDGQGGFNSTFEFYKNIWCKVVPKSGTEKKENGRLNTTQYLEITCRYFDGLTETAQLVYKGEKLQIRSIVNVEEMDEWLVIKAERKAKAQ